MEGVGEGSKEIGEMKKRFIIILSIQSILILIMLAYSNLKNGGSGTAGDWIVSDFGLFCWFND